MWCLPFIEVVFGPETGVEERQNVWMLSCLDLKRVSTACMGVQCPWLKLLFERQHVWQFYNNY